MREFEDEEQSEIEVRFPSRRHLLGNSRVDGSVLSIFFPTSRLPPAGHLVEVRVMFSDSPLRFELRGKVKFHRATSFGPSQPTGIALSFEGDQKRIAAQMLAQCAGKPVELGSAMSPRYGKVIDCVVRVGKRALPAQVRDLSITGAFVVSPSGTRIAVGSEVQIVLRRGIFGFGAKRVSAKVVWFGEKRGTLGFGARFLGERQTLRPALRGYLPSGL